MQFTPSNREDISKYYRNSFLKFKETGDMLFYLSSVDTHAAMGTIEDGRDFKVWLADEEPYEVDYILPHKSFFQFGEHACMLQRIPAKQYHRGITQENTKITYREAESGMVGNIALGFEVLKAFVKKQHFLTLQEAIQSKEQSSVLGPRFMYQNKFIFIDFQSVAKIAGTKIYMTKPVFEEEIREFLKSTQEDQVFTLIQKGVPE
jgi:hypothetical protein